jgi:hypothetical protein
MERFERPSRSVVEVFVTPQDIACRNDGDFCDEARSEFKQILRVGSVSFTVLRECGHQRGSDASQRRKFRTLNLVQDTIRALIIRAAHQPNGHEHDGEHANHGNTQSRNQAERSGSAAGLPERSEGEAVGWSLLLAVIRQQELTIRHKRVI